MEWTKVVQAAVPAVVSISSKTMGFAPSSGSQQPAFSEPFSRSTMRSPFNGPRRGRNTGSGVLVSPEGYILTTYHVIEGAEDILVTLADRRKLRAQIVGVDTVTDLAVLKIPGTGFPVLPLGDSARVEVAEPVVAIGNPFGLTQTVTMGIVSAVGRANVGITDYEDYIQTDAAINPGNSGGGLINACGELVGINTALFSTSGTYMGVGFAVPINIARSVLEQILAHGRVSRGWLGVVVQELTPTLARGLGKPELPGLLVSDVTIGSPGGQAGLRRDDIILRYHELPVDDVGRFRNLVAQSIPGSRLSLTIYRDGQEHKLHAVVGERQEAATLPEAAGTEVHQLGMELVDLDLALTRRLGVPLSSQGAVVVEVLPGSVAETAGLQSGDVIQEVNRQPVKSASDFERLAEQAIQQPLILFVTRAGTTVYILIEFRS
jgi:serine protease Do